MSSIAFAQQHKIFQRLESVTNYANLDEDQRRAYDEDLKIYRDFQNCMQTNWENGVAKGREEGIKEGREEGLKEGIKEGLIIGQNNIIRTLHESGMSADTIATYLRMPLDHVEKILNT